MSLTTKISDDSSEIQVFYGNTLVGYISIGNGYIDYDDELDRKSYNLLTIDDGRVTNNVPMAY